MARLGGKITATLSCRHYPRIEDTLFNRVLVSGLKLAGSIASNVELRREYRRLVGQIEEQVSAINLNAEVMSQAEQQLTRLTKNYRPAMSIIRLLVDRDTWEKDLPRHMLYQLVVYAVSHRDQPRSTILYPTFHPGARETRIEVMDPVYGNVIGEVRLCPVNLERLEALVNDLTEQGRREREVYAFRLAQHGGRVRGNTSSVDSCYSAGLPLEKVLDPLMIDFDVSGAGR